MPLAVSLFSVSTTLIYGHIPTSLNVNTIALARLRVVARCGASGQGVRGHQAGNLPVAAHREQHGGALRRELCSICMQKLAPLRERSAGVLLATRPASTDLVNTPCNPVHFEGAWGLAYVCFFYRLCSPTVRVCQAALVASLGRLGRPRVDVMQLHWSAANYAPWQEPALRQGLVQCYQKG
jgi:hypothetical protein